MPVYSITDIANARGYSYSATVLHIQEAKKRGFVKTGIGIYFNEEDITKLEKIIGFTMPRKKNGETIPKQTRIKF